VDLVRDLSAIGYVAKDIAHRTGISEADVIAIRIRHNIEPARGKRLDTRVHPDRLETISLMTGAGHADAVIADALDITAGEVSRLRGVYQLPTPRRDLGLRLEVIETIIKMHSQGATMAETADAIGVHKTTIARLFRRLGWTWGSHNIGARQKPSITRDFIRAGVKAGLSASQIADQNGIARAFVSRVLSEEGLTPHRPLKTVAQHWETIRPLIREGLSTAEITRRTGIGGGTIRKVCRRYNVRPADGRTRRDA
jgi:DNA invertase Pin-like site-specific DNA recombinase